MRKNLPRKKWWQETREKADVRLHAIGVAAAIGYAFLVIIVALIFAVAAALLFPPSAGAQEQPTELRTSTELIGQAAELDGQTVIYEGEAIGEALERGRFAWVNVNDGKNAIGIWMTSREASGISRFGDYKNNGDLLRVTGRFNRACPQHGGDLDIHAAEVQILREGSDRPHPLARGKLIAAVASSFLLGAAVLLYGRRKRPGR